MGFTQVFPLKLGTAIRIGSFEVTPHRALDADVDSIFQIQAQGLNVLNVVDSWIDYDTLEELIQKGPWDLILWPFQTMREIEVIAPSRSAPASGCLPEEWLEQLQSLNPRFIVPSSCQFILESWSWYNHAFFPITYRQFQSQIESLLPGAQVVRLNPSVSFDLSKDSFSWSAPLPWVLPVGEQDVDYDYRPDIKPPNTAEVAKHFPALSSENRDKVLAYCRRGLLEKFRSLESSEDPYFQKPLCWRLTVYDHLGNGTHFFYRIEKSDIELLEKSAAPLAWVTEVPMEKLYAALERGESLTSMYMRINDEVFSPEIEEEIQNVDIVEDPLIRCLFTGVFGAYQKAQLQSLKG